MVKPAQPGTPDGVSEHCGTAAAERGVAAETETAFAPTMRTIASQSNGASASPRTTAPIAAANTGLRAHEDPEECAGTRRSARRSARNGTTDDSTPAAARARQRRRRRRMSDERRRSPTGTYTSADSAPAAADPSTPGSSPADGAVEQDVARPARRGEQAQADADVGPCVGCGRVSTTTPTPASSAQISVSVAARGGVAVRERSHERDGQGAEELQRHRQPQADAVDRGVQGETFMIREHRGERQHGPPLPGGERPQPRPAHRQHDHPGHPLAHRNDADRPDHREGQGPERRAGLAAQRAAEHQRGSRHTAPGPHGGAVVGATADRIRVSVSTIRACGRERPFTKCIVRYSLYAGRMDVELRHLRCLAAIVDAGASPEPPPSSASRSRRCRARSPDWRTRSGCGCCVAPAGRSCSPRRASGCWRTPAGCSPRSTTSHGRPGAGSARLRIGHAWAAMGEHTVEFQRRWAAQPPRRRRCTLVRTNTPTGGLAEGACDVAIVRASTDLHRPGRRGGSTAPSSASSRGTARWPPTTHSPAADSCAWPTSPTASWPSIPAPARPRPTSGHPTAAPVEEIHDVDDWLAVIATGRCVGVTAESTLDPVPAPRRRLPPPARRTAGARTAGLVARRPAPRHARRRRPARRALPRLFASSPGSAAVISRGDAGAGLRLRLRHPGCSRAENGRFARPFVATRAPVCSDSRGRCRRRVSAETGR